MNERVSSLGTTKKRRTSMLLLVFPTQNLSAVVALALVVAALSHIATPTWAARQATSGSKSQPHMVARVLEGDACNVGRNAIAWVKTWFSAKGPALLANADFALSRTATLKKFEFTLVRCPDAVSYNTCEYFDTWKFPAGGCALLKAKRMPWTDWMESFKPQVRCPFRAGNYSFREAGIDPSTLHQFGLPLENTFWITTIKLFDAQQREYICVNFTMEFKRRRN